VAEWLRSGLQIRVPRFNSGRGLQSFSKQFSFWTMVCSAQAGRRGSLTPARSLGPSAAVAIFPFECKNRPVETGRKKTKGLASAGTFCYAERFPAFCTAFRGSSVVERPTVNRMVVGSNPTRGARLQLCRCPHPSPRYRDRVHWSRRAPHRRCGFQAIIWARAPKSNRRTITGDIGHLVANGSNRSNSFHPYELRGAFTAIARKSFVV
jgi:hypothetical protein